MALLIIIILVVFVISLFFGTFKFETYPRYTNVRGHRRLGTWNGVRQHQRRIKDGNRIIWVPYQKKILNDIFFMMYPLVLNFFEDKSSAANKKEISETQDKFDLKSLNGNKLILFSIEGKLYIFDRNMEHAKNEFVYLFKNQTHEKKEFEINRLNLSDVTDVTDKLSNVSFKQYLIFCDKEYPIRNLYSEHDNTMNYQKEAQILVSKVNEVFEIADLYVNSLSIHSHKKTKIEVLIENIKSDILLFDNEIVTLSLLHHFENNVSKLNELIPASIGEIKHERDNNVGIDMKKIRFFYAEKIHNTWPKLFVLTEDDTLYSEYLDNYNRTVFKEHINYSSFDVLTFRWNGYQPLVEIDLNTAVSTNLTNQPNWILNYIQNM